MSTIDSSAEIGPGDSASGGNGIPVVPNVVPEVPEADLARVIEAWPTLPDAVRAGIVAMVRASAKYDSVGRG